MKDGDIRAVSFIRASRSDIWDALTKSETIAAYHPTGMQVAALPEGGHELKRPDDGSTFIREALVAAEPGERLELTFEPVWADVPEGGSTVTFEVMEEEIACKVTLTQSIVPVSGSVTTGTGFSRP